MAPVFLGTVRHTRGVGANAVGRTTTLLVGPGRVEGGETPSPPPLIPAGSRILFDVVTDESIPRDCIRVGGRYYRWEGPRIREYRGGDMPRTHVRENLNTYTVTIPTTAGAVTYQPPTVHYDEFATAFGPTPNMGWFTTNTIPEPERLPTIYEDGDLTVSFRAEEGEAEEAYRIQFGGPYGWTDTIPTNKALGIARAIFEDIDKRYRGDHEGIIHTEDVDTEAQDPPLHGLGDGERPEAGGSDPEIPWEATP